MPTLILVTSEFVTLAQACLKAKGYAHLPMVVLPHPFETLPKDEVRRIADERFEEIVQKMTMPVKQPAPAKS